jgi:hypothetical protein
MMLKYSWKDIDTKEDLHKARNLLIDNACKGRNDLLATYVNKPIENFIVSIMANTKILFASLLTFIVSFMDGVDGKLSRVKMASSHIGKMEHPFDFLFEHSWYIALALFLSSLWLSFYLNPMDHGQLC